MSQAKSLSRGVDKEKTMTDTERLNYLLLDKYNVADTAPSTLITEIHKAGLTSIIESSTLLSVILHIKITPKLKLTIGELMCNQIEIWQLTHKIKNNR